MHHAWVILKVLVAVKLVILAVAAIVLLQPLLRGRQRLIPYA